jgi:hypothetical protein
MNANARTGIVAGVMVFIAAMAILFPILGRRSNKTAPEPETVTIPVPSPTAETGTAEPSPAPVPIPAAPEPYRPGTKPHGCPFKLYVNPDLTAKSVHFLADRSYNKGRACDDVTQLLMERHRVLTHKDWQD